MPPMVVLSIKREDPRWIEPAEAGYMSMSSRFERKTNQKTLPVGENIEVEKAVP